MFFVDNKYTRFDSFCRIEFQVYDDIISIGQVPSLGWGGQYKQWVNKLYDLRPNWNPRIVNIKNKSGSRLSYLCLDVDNIVVRRDDRVISSFNTLYHNEFVEDYWYPLKYFYKESWA